MQQLSPWHSTAAGAAQASPMSAHRVVNNDRSIEVPRSSWSRTAIRLQPVQCLSACCPIPHLCAPYGKRKEASFVAVTRAKRAAEPAAAKRAFESRGLSLAVTPAPFELTIPSLVMKEVWHHADIDILQHGSYHGEREGNPYFSGYT